MLFFGFKLHLLINHQGEILGLNISPGNTNDRVSMPDLCKISLVGYIGNKLVLELKNNDVDLITTVRKNMKEKVNSTFDMAMLSMRYIIETVNDQLKNLTQIEHNCHRSKTGFMLNVMSGIVAYCLKK